MAESVLAKMPMPARLAIAAGLVILGALAYYVVFYSEISGQIEATVLARANLEGELRAAQKAEAAYQKDYMELAKRRERKRELAKVLPLDAQTPAFLQSLQTAAKAAGIELSGWIPQPEVKEDYFARIPMKIRMKGRFHQVAKFLYAVGQSDRIMNVEDISLDRPEVVDQDVYVEVQGLATAFRALSEEEAKPAQGGGRRR